MRHKSGKLERGGYLRMLKYPSPGEMTEIENRERERRKEGRKKYLEVNQLR